MPHPKVKISDDSGNTVDVTSNALDVNIAGGASIDIGDVDMFLDGGTAIVGGAGHVEAGVLRVTLADNDAHWGSVGAAADVDGVAHGQLKYIGDNTKGALDILSYTVKATGGQYTEGTGSLIPIVRNDTLASLVTDDNDFAPLQVNADGALYVDVADGGQLDTIIDTLETTLTAIETDQAAIETLLTGIDSDTDAIKTAVQILDDWDDSNYANVNINLAGSDAPTGGGTESGVLRVTLANDSTGVLTVDNAGTFATQVDGDALTALQLIDDAIHVDDGDFTLGTSKGIPMMAFQGSQSIDTDDVGVLRCTSGGALHINITSASGAILTSSEQTLGGASGYSEASTVGSMAGAVRNDTLATLANTDNEFAPLQVDAQGALYTTHGITGMVSDGNNAVGTSAEQLNGATDDSYDQACKRVDLQAALDNTGYILVGDSGLASNLSGGGIKLNAGDFYSMDVNNVGDIYVLAEVNAEDIFFTYFT